MSIQNHPGLRCEVVEGRSLSVKPPFLSVRQGQIQRLATPLATASASTYPVLQLPRKPTKTCTQEINIDDCVEELQKRLTVTRTRTVKPLLKSPAPGFLGGSHTQPANSGIAAYGCYRLIGPARIRKRGNCLVARLLPGARLELLCEKGGSGDAVVRDSMRKPFTVATQLPTADGWDVQCACACASEDGEENGEGEGDKISDGHAVAECVLVAAYLELGGSASSMDQVDTSLLNAVHHHNGHTYLSVRHLPPSVVITLSADGDLSHPVNVTPPVAAQPQSA